MLSSCIIVHGKEAVVTAIRSRLPDYSIKILMEQLIPSLGNYIDINCQTFGLSASENRTRLENALLRWMQAMCSLCEPFPFVIILDDFHWATEQVISLLKVLLEYRELSILFVCTHRPSEGNTSSGYFPVHKFTKELSENSLTPITHITLTGLDTESASRLIANMMGAASFSVTPLAERLQHTTHGNPFFITQVMLYTL